MEKLKGWLKSIKQDSVLLVVILLAVLGCMVLRTTEQTVSGDAETRLSHVLSAMEGVGHAEVVIRTETIPTSSGGGEKPVGAVVVADGASDVSVRLALVRAVTTLLDLPSSSVEVFSAAEGK